MRSDVFAKYRRKSGDTPTEVGASREETAANVEYSPTHPPESKVDLSNNARASAMDAPPETARGLVLAETIPDEALVEMSEWDDANAQLEKQQHDERTANSSRVAVGMPSITFREAYEYLRSNEKSWTKFLTSELKRVSDHVVTSGLWSTLWSCWHSDITEGSEEYTERDFVLALQFVTLDHGDAVHRRMLCTIFRKLTRPPRNSADPQSFGGHWERIGFQGSDPGTDLRSTGMLGLLQILYLLDFYPTFCGALYASAVNPLTEFPFVLVCFNFSGVAMESLKERGLHDDIAARRKAAAKDRAHGEKTKAVVASSSSHGQLSSDFDFKPPPVMQSVCEFYIGSLWEFFVEWRKAPTRPVTDFGSIKAKLRPYVRQHVAATLKHCVRAGDRKHVNTVTSNRSAVAFSSTNGGKDEKEFMEF